ncbi:MAG: hypothetical protein Q8881_04285, partial [Sweet potato little leaf phytoplasma]|nr:hypothetical protein [Sweet potato little leaf phytoplasma]
MNPNEFTPNFVLGDVSAETAEFRSQGRFQQNRRSNPAEFRTWDDSDEMAEFPPNFALGDISPETAESISANFHRISHSGRFRRNGRINLAKFLPNFTLGTFTKKRPNFRQISPSGTFPTTWSNFRRISHSWTVAPTRPKFRRI